METLTESEIDFLLRAAVAAPSADNNHPWRLEFRHDRLNFHLPQAHAMALTRWRLSLISLGAVVESLRICASTLNIHLEPVLHPGQRATPLSLHWHRATMAADPLAPEIPRRHSNRSLRYSGPRLQVPEQKRLDSHAQLVVGSRVVWLDQPALRRAACKLIGRAETLRFQVRALHGELFEAVRFDQGWHQSCTIGLPPGSLGVGWHERHSFQLMRHWRFQRLMNFFGAHHLLGQRSAGLPARFCPHLCLIGAEGELEDAALKAGQLLQRVWCEASRLGLAAQVLAASPTYSLPQASDIPTPIQEVLAQEWRNLFPVGHPFVVLRLGHARPPEIRTGRPPHMSFMQA